MLKLTSHHIAVAFAAAFLSLAMPSCAPKNSILGKTRADLQQILKGWTVHGHPMGSPYYTRDGVEVSANYKGNKIIGIQVGPANNASKLPGIDQRLRDTKELLGLSTPAPNLKPY